MEILDIQFKNFASYGNKLQHLNFEDTDGELYLVTGANGSGKCLSKDTNITIRIEDPNLLKKFKTYLQNK